MTERTGAMPYPLAWPAGWQRTTGARAEDPFARGARARNLTVLRGVQEVLEELERLGARGVVISTNLRLRQDGIPASGQRVPDDPGVAVYFTLRGEERVLACDRWRRVEGNLRAIAKHVEATRGMLRWGVGSVEQAFRGFVGIPEHASRERRWREVLGLEHVPKLDRAIVLAAFRERAFHAHPDRGGSTEAMAELNVARDQALAELAA